MEITQLSIAELADARERINERQNALEDAAIATLGTGRSTSDGA